MSTSNDDYQLARRRVIAKTVYKSVVALWAVLGLTQVTIWYLTTPGGYFWPAWPIAASVIAAIAWGIPTYARRPVISESHIQAELSRMRADN